MAGASIGAILFIYSNVYESVYHDYAASKQHAEYQHQFEKKCSKLPTAESVFRCFIEQSKASREAQRAEEDLYAQKKMAQWAWWVVVVSVAIGAPTVAFTFIGLRFVIRTYEEARKTTAAAQSQVEIAERALYEDQRPWISVKCAVNGPLIIAEDEIKIDISFILQNFGRSPATGVFIHPRIVFDFPNATRILASQTAESTETADRRDLMGNILFPNEKTPYGFTVNATRDSINAWREKSGMKDSDALSPILVGTVSYKAPGSVKFHHTGFLINVFRADRSGGAPYVALTDRIGTISKEDIVLIIMPIRPTVT